MDKKQRIILTMLELVVKQGYHATPMSQVAKEANVAVGTIYHYFETKEKIIEAIFLMVYKDLSVVLLTNMKPDDTYKKKFTTKLHNMYNYFTSNPLAFYFIEYVGVPPIITPEMVKKTVPFYKKITDFFLEGITEKRVKNMDETLIMKLCYGLISSVVKLKIKEELPMDQKQIDQSIEACWDAIKYSDNKLFA
ncbi:TetR family transcriptional regulator [Lacinutrix sp. WUR7]|uniref:TetR/AcrR family transcriptional regulator n=1 Tax=Lacinutrix sp. WUR7 TaxID=2653681 RepID=UPI00193E4505|nr:TetR/AcrR family transcriptional regulator [Lacinutrix sp. WUR7]QRM88289.1 TetR family transcriptional regulator [Lacinutrix sp. WUR7]